LPGGSEVIVENAEDNWENAKISYDGYVGRELAGGPIEVYRFQCGASCLWFVAEPVWASNGDDFSIRVSKFGFMRKSNAANAGSIWQEKFDENTAKAIKTRLVSFFMGNEEKPFGPYNYNRGGCQAVFFSDGWIMLK
jgi:hypothetical protein